VLDDQVLVTALRIMQRFDELYPVNRNKKERPGIAIGRYPECRYDGYTTSGEGNPWVLATNGFAEYFYRVAKALRRQGRITVTAANLPFYRAMLPPGKASALSAGAMHARGDKLFAAVLKGLCRHGDDFIRCVLAHADGGSLSEQIHHTTGAMTGAPDLTWSYASLISALLHRPKWAAY
jgi:glucoamylase